MVPYPLRRHAQLFTYRDEQRVSSLCLSRVNLNSPPYTALYISLYALTYIYICISHYSNGFSAFFYWDTLKIRRIMHAYINKNIHGVFRLFLSIIPSPPSWSFRSHRQLEDLVHFPLSYSSAPNPSNTRGQPLLMFILKTPGCSNSPLAVSCKRTAFQLAICPSPGLFPCPILTACFAWNYSLVNIYFQIILRNFELKYAHICLLVFLSSSPWAIPRPSWSLSSFSDELPLTPLLLASC